MDGTDQGFVTMDIPDDQQVSQVVVETVAAVEGIEATDLSTQLYESVDPEALDSLCDTGSDRDRSLRVTFTFAGHEVAVADGDRITVREAADDGTP